MLKRVATVLLGWSFVLMVSGDVQAAERLARHISDIPGMPAGMTDVGQDTTGYLWISSNEGLHRYDGFEVRPWSPDAPTGRLEYVSTGTGARVLAGVRSGILLEVAGPTLRRVEPPQGVTTPGPADAVYDNDGILWAAWDGRLFRRDGMHWSEVGEREIADESASRLSPRRDGGVLLGTVDGSIWSVAPNGGVQRVAHDLGGRVTQLIDDPAGAAAVVRFGPNPGVVRVSGDGVERLLDYSGRADGMARRGSTWWVAYATGVWALDDDGAREFMSTREGFSGLGTITSDREGGLWMSSAKGLRNYPEPATRFWTELSGLPRVHLREVHRVPEGYMLMSWRGPVLFDADTGRAEELDLGRLFSRDLGCADPWGGVWLKTLERPPAENLESPPAEAILVEWRDGQAHERFRLPWFNGDLACDVDPAGSLWLLADGKVFTVSAPGESPRLWSRMPPNADGPLWQRAMVVRRDMRSIVVTFQSGEVCETARPAADAFVEESAWTCERAAGVSNITDVAETPSGSLWLATAGKGVLERTDDGGWLPVPGELSDLNSALGVEPSPSGGVWVVGWRERWRVEERAPGKPPIVVERLGTAHGVPAWQNGRRMLEETDGTVWIPLYSALVQVPPEVRRRVVAPPTVTLTHLVADGRLVAAGEPLLLRHGDHSLEVRWSALSFRDPTRVRYRMRLDSEPGWTVLNQPFVRLAGLSSGRHRVELGASLDGRTWTDEPVAVEFKVRIVWYAQAWFIALTAGLLLSATYLAFRLRVAHLLRLERQRTHIAMDLHDEMGAGLGSAGLLVGLLGEVDLEHDERRRISERAIEQIRDLGGALSDIVWSLRPGTETLEALLLFLRQRASDLFPPGGPTRVTVDAPDPCPALRLDLGLRRNLQWIVVEALHNAARHAEATRVVVRLRPEGDGWVLAVRDDGTGFAEVEDDVETDAQVAGLGQESMQRRADEIGAALAVRSAPGEGTEVAIRFRTGRTRP